MAACAAQHVLAWRALLPTAATLKFRCKAKHGRFHPPCPPFEAWQHHTGALQLEQASDSLATAREPGVNLSVCAAAQPAGCFNIKRPAEPGRALAEPEGLGLPLLARIKVDGRVGQLGLRQALAKRAYGKHALVVRGLSKGEHHAIQVPLCGTIGGLASRAVHQTSVQGTHFFCRVGGRVHTSAAERCATQELKHAAQLVQRCIASGCMHACSASSSAAVAAACPPHHRRGPVGGPPASLQGRSQRRLQKGWCQAGAGWRRRVWQGRAQK